MFAELFSVSTNNPNYVREANVRPIKNGPKHCNDTKAWLFAVPYRSALRKERNNATLG